MGRLSSLQLVISGASAKPTIHQTEVCCVTKSGALRKRLSRRSSRST